MIALFPIFSTGMASSFTNLLIADSDNPIPSAAASFTVSLIVFINFLFFNFLLPPVVVFLGTVNMTAY